MSLVKRSDSFEVLTLIIKQVPLKKQFLEESTQFDSDVSVTMYTATYHHRV